MDANHYKVKKKLSEELEWLRKNYPLPLFPNIELFVYRTEDYNAFYKEAHEDTYEQKEIDAFLMETLDGETFEHGIFLIVSEQHQLDEVDKMILEKGDVKEEHLYYFMLYHEYGHLIHLHDSYEKKGIEGYLFEKEEMENELYQLIISKDQKRIPENEFHIRYRELWFEKMADDFAYEVYKKQKETFE